MYYKTLSFLALSATALAAPQEDSYNEQVSEVLAQATNPSVFASEVGLPTSAVESLFAAMPSGYAQSLVQNQDYAESVFSDAATGKFPDWFTSVPSSIQSQISSGVSGGVVIPVSATSGMTSVTGSSSGSAAPSSSSSGSPSSASASSTDASSSSSASSSPSGSSASASGSTTDNAAPAHTAMAMGVAGAAGVLGIALAL